MLGQESSIRSCPDSKGGYIIVARRVFGYIHGYSIYDIMFHYLQRLLT